MKKRNPSYMPRVLLIICLAAGGLYLGNLTVFNIWQSAFPDNRDVLDVLRLRAWTFGVLAVAMVASAATLVVVTIRQING